MPAPSSLAQLVAAIAQHTEELPPEATRPIEHYRRGANDAWNLWSYFARNIRRTNVYYTAYERHATRLRSMVLLSLVEAFERYIKETAAICVDHVARLVLDERLNVFRLKATSVAAHFDEESLGRALCEGDTWLDCEEIDRRFRQILADPFKPGSFNLFGQTSGPDGWRRGTTDTLFQLRHVIAHNISVLTRSDAAKLRLLVKAPVDAPKMLAPTEQDVRSAKRFLDDTVRWANARIADRLAELLTTIYADHPGAFAAQERADQVTHQFDHVVTIAGSQGVPRSP